jgi:hypothetical protein
MIDRKHDLPITRQAEVLSISRGSVYYLPRPVSATDLEVMRRLDRLHLEFPFAGSRMLRGLLVADSAQPNEESAEENIRIKSICILTDGLASSVPLTPL